MVDVDAASFLVIVVVAAVAALTAGTLGRRLVVPVVVIELLLGIMIGPDLLGIADSDAFIDFFANLGLAMLFFFAGYEIDLQRIRGLPLRLAVIGWLLSLAIAFAASGLLELAGVVASWLFAGSAMATTAIGTLLPILRDAGELRTRFGTFLMAAGAVGEFGPILIVTLVFSTRSALDNAAVLIAFVALAVAAGVVAVRWMGRGWPLLERTLESSGQAAIRVAVVIVFALVALATEMGLDVLLGGFVAGIILRAALRDREVTVLESKLAAVGYGFLIPFFFVASGIRVDVAALVEDPGTLLDVPLFLALFLLARGGPVLLLQRRTMDLRDRAALGLFTATQLPLVVAITTIAVDEGHMASATAASLVVAAILSTALFPIAALRLRGDRATAAGA